MVEQITRPFSVIDRRRQIRVTAAFLNIDKYCAPTSVSTTVLAPRRADFRDSNTDTTRARGDDFSSTIRTGHRVKRSARYRRFRKTFRTHRRHNGFTYSASSSSSLIRIKRRTECVLRTNDRRKSEYGIS